MSSGDAAPVASSPEKPTSPMSPSKNHAKFPFLVPSPVITRRTRTQSMSKRAADGPTKKGTVMLFERSRGHGFILPDGKTEKIFVHISDIEGEYVPVEGDRVTFKECPLPPKMDKMQAVEVVITEPNPETKHASWDSAPSS